MEAQIDIRTELVNFLSAHPFTAFTIVMASGDRHEVGDPHALAVGQTSAILVPPRGAGHSVLRLNQISSLDALEPA